MQKDVVYRQIIDSVRNILALFLASALFAYFFMNLARSLQDVRERNAVNAPYSPEIWLGLVKPVFFLATFTEHLNYAFLPQYVQGVVQASGVAVGFTSMPFIAYYLCFALSLIPAERAERLCGPHRLIWGGLALAACGLLTLAGQFGFASIVVARAISGVGQGLLFIGVQSYILQTTTRDSRTRGASVIVVGFQAGMISGMAIGSLLVTQLGARGVFDLGAGVAAVTALYVLAAIPSAVPSASNAGVPRPTVWRNILLTLRDVDFLKAIGLIGLPAKAVLTGVILFALPLLLANQGFGQEDVGQITMMYAISVIAGSSWVSGRRNGPHATAAILVWGAILSGAGLLLISILGWKMNLAGVSGIPATAVIVTGVMIVGLGHGFINAPVVTQVTGSKISGRLGAVSVAATYRLLERAGHTAGPVVVGQVIAYTASSPLALGWIGGTLIVFGLIFAASCINRQDGLEAEVA
jgi:predicted MFS family arabinose efflux permease